jgi:uncharacterized protein YbbC (DUF1343 family)
MRKDTTAMASRPVLTGAERIAQDPSPLQGERIGLLTNFTGVLSGLERNLDAFIEAGLDIRAVFAPEHGLRGTAQAGDSEPGGTDAETGLPVIDTYGAAGDALDRLIDRSDLDTIVFDMQDIGVRYWTYTWTMFDAMASAARTGKRFVVLDRPNPLGGIRTAGPGLLPAFSSFVGRVDVPQRHGLTSGELARLFNRSAIPERAGSAADLRVIPVAGWHRAMTFEDTGLPWVMPSPNLPTLDSALAFAGTGLFEGTNLSEGRGTTRPFELVGAPYADARFAAALRDSGLPGVAFRDVSFVPTFHKHAGETVRGVQLHIQDRESFEPVGCALTMMALLAELYPTDFAFLDPRPGGTADEQGYPIDRLWGSDLLRRTVEGGGDARELSGAGPDAPERYPSGVLLYPANAAARATMVEETV